MMKFRAGACHFLNDEDYQIVFNEKKGEYKKERVKMSNLLQKIGTALLVVSLVFLYLYAAKEALFCYVLLGGVLGIDLWLVYKKEKTITQWFRPKLPKLVDIILTIGIVVAFALQNPLFGLYMLMGTINGHLNGDW